MLIAAVRFDEDGEYTDHSLAGVLIAKRTMSDSEWLRLVQQIQDAYYETSDDESDLYELPFDDVLKQRFADDVTYQSVYGNVYI